MISNCYLSPTFQFFHLWTHPVAVLGISSCRHRRRNQWSGRNAGRHVQRLCLCSVPLPAAPPAGAWTLVLHPNVQVPPFLLLQELLLYSDPLLVLLLQRLLITGEKQEKFFCFFFWPNSFFFIIQHFVEIVFQNLIDSVILSADRLRRLVHHTLQSVLQQFACSACWTSWSG